MALLATLAVLAVLVLAIPSDGSWQAPLVFVLLVAIIASTLYEFRQRRTRP